MRNQKNNLLRRLLVGGAGLICSLNAYADASDPSLWGQLGQLLPPTNDPVRSMVSGIFGDAGGIGLFGGQTSVGEMFLAFNSALMIIAGAWLTWITFKATVNSAHDGEFLGKQYHSAWVPVRNAIGIIALTPLPFLHGWNLAQAAMAACMLVGIGTGNIVATHSVEFIQATSKVGIAMPSIPDVTRLGAQIRAARLDLLQLQNMMAQRQRDGVSSEDSNVNFTYTVGSAADNTLYLTFGANPPINGYSAVRGQIKIPQVNVVSSDDPDLVALQRAINSSMASAATDLAQRIDVQYSTLIGLDPSDPGYAMQTASVEQAITAIVQDEQNAVRDAIKASVASANNNVSSTSARFLQSHGWMGVGFILPFVSQRNQEANDATTASASTATGTAKEQPMVTQMVCTGTDWVECSEQQVPATDHAESGGAGGGMFADFLNALGFNEMMSIMKGAASTATTIFKEGLTKYLNDKMTDALNKGGLLGSLTDAVGATGGGGTIATMASIGIKTVKIASTISLVLGAAAVVAGMIPFVSLGASVAAIAAISAPFVAMLFVAGFSMAAVLPWIPFTLWLGAIASMFVVYGEALLAAPLWALAHLEDSGDGMGQQTQRGYVFTLTLLFGPAVLVIAYTFSTALFEALASMANSFISGGLIKMIHGSDGWFTTIILLIGAIITLFTVNISLIYACYGMPIKVVQKVFTWIGGDFGANVTPDMEGAGKAAEGKAQSAGHATHQTHANTLAGGGNVAGALAQDGNRAGGAAGRGLSALAGKIRGGNSAETDAGTADAASMNSIEPGQDISGGGADAGASGGADDATKAAVPSGDAAATGGQSGSSMIVDSKGVPFKSASAPVPSGDAASSAAPGAGGRDSGAGVAAGGGGGGDLSTRKPGGGGAPSAAGRGDQKSPSPERRAVPSSWGVGYNNPTTGPVDAAMMGGSEVGRLAYGKGGAVRSIARGIADVGGAIAERMSKPASSGGGKDGGGTSLHGDAAEPPRPTSESEITF
ncbi:hypothetical protein E2P84_43715 [Burkholderia cepacia]|uniref:Uncharacterized protein n=2 Tax=Burkholderia cepacia TaxID=292 RepID=A0AAX2RS39_BURCE|nr:DotA/TraY family protein [Burkholderia cepacia]TES61340.1 hypothetical protein E2P84_43715 [Burkholderia cepacia]TET01718.1 hypothetical protein E3D36_16925 [Burkholderia cepacia]TEU47576.1 hypothetical protein E3D37_16355 [Burkholderia cepacia]TEU53448.1 hypothetical protein E3D38_11940 [Burkholderia cepacia]TEV07865.1 hypothetical protein E3D44_18870 [Burkholderia cepacia]